MSRGIITNSAVAACNIYKKYLMSCLVNNMQIAIPVPSTLRQPSQTWGQGKCASTRKKTPKDNRNSKRSRKGWWMRIELTEGWVRLPLGWDECRTRSFHLLPRATWAAPRLAATLLTGSYSLTKCWVFVPHCCDPDSANLHPTHPGVSGSPLETWQGRPASQLWLNLHACLPALLGRTWRAWTD